MLKRKVWPIWACISAVLVALNLSLMSVSIFGDGRFAWFLIPGISINLASFIAWALFGEDTYEKKPRGWRKERRRAEKEAYVRLLEQELLDD